MPAFPSQSPRPVRTAPRRAARQGLPAVLAALSLLAPAARADESERPLESLPYTPSLDPVAMDTSVDPCTDFYAYSCGGWQKRNPIPADRGSWAVYPKTALENQQFLWGMLQSAAVSSASRTPDQARIGDAFGSCMDTSSIEAAGLAPLQVELKAIAALADKAAIPAWMGAAHRSGLGGGLLFGYGSGQDLEDSERVIAWTGAGGLGLPDRDYYLKNDEKSKETRQKYVDHVTRMFGLLGDTPEASAAAAKTVLKIETTLAKATLTNVASRDPRRLKNPMDAAGLKGLTKDFDWNAYWAALGATPPAKINVTEPKFFKGASKVLRKTSLPELKTWFRWTTINARARALPAKVFEADFDFYDRTLQGAKEMPPRWKTCVRWVDDNMGEALGKVFVEKGFSPDAKAAAADMVARIQKAMDARIQGLTWMGDATKTRAREKLAAMKNKIGYPDKWRDYSALTIKPADYYGNSVRALSFETARDLGKIGKPVDRTEWGMTPPTVNAYYDAANNDMNFPAGVLLPPLFDLKLDAAPNYGDTGGTVGHELIHGFDDEGRMFDAKGNLSDWWTAADAAEFERRADCLVQQYGSYPVVDDLKINSRLTLGEDLADLGGLILAWEAWKDLTKGGPHDKIGGLTPGQRFFVGFAQWDCANDSPESLRLRALTNPHSPAKYRINGVVVNMPEFAEAFSCPAGSAMTKPKDAICHIW